MRAIYRKSLRVIRSAILAFLITAVGTAVWGVLITVNLRTSPEIPWSVGIMAAVLWAMWNYLGGKWWPRSTSEARRRYLRAKRVPFRTFAWAFLAGAFSIVALAGLWIVSFRLVRMAPNAVPAMAGYPWLTVVPVLIMASLVAPFCEEAAFRGYCQVCLECEFRLPVALLLSSMLFALAHLTHGVFLAKLFVYFLAGVVFGATAGLTQSTLPAIPVHIAADLTFFVLVWPHDAARHLVSEDGADWAFWIHLAQIVLFAPLAVLAFRRLAKETEGLRPARGIPVSPN